MREVALDGLDADVQFGRGLPVRPPGADEAGHRLLGGGETDEGGCGFWRHGRASGGEFPVAGLQQWLGAEGDQPLPGGRSRATAARGWPAARSRRASEISSWARASGQPQALGAAPGGRERRGGGVPVPGCGGQVAAQPGRGHQGRRRAGRVQVRLQLGQRRSGLAEAAQADERVDLQRPPVVAGSP